MPFLFNYDNDNLYYWHTDKRERYHETLIWISFFTYPVIPATSSYRFLMVFVTKHTRNQRFRKRTGGIRWATLIQISQRREAKIHPYEKNKVVLSLQDFRFAKRIWDASDSDQQVKSRRNRTGLQRSVNAHLWLPTIEINASHHTKSLRMKHTMIHLSNTVFVNCDF